MLDCVQETSNIVNMEKVGGVRGGRRGQGLKDLGFKTMATIICFHQNQVKKILYSFLGCLSTMSEAFFVFF